MWLSFAPKVILRLCDISSTTFIGRKSNGYYHWLQMSQQQPQNNSGRSNPITFKVNQDYLHWEYHLSILISFFCWPIPWQSPRILTLLIMYSSLYTCELDILIPCSGWILDYDRHTCSAATCLMLSQCMSNNCGIVHWIMRNKVAPGNAACCYQWYLQREVYFWMDSRRCMENCYSDNSWSWV